MPITAEELTKTMENLEFIVVGKREITIRVKKGRKVKMADKWLGKFSGILPKGMTSTEYIKRLRESGYSA
jgi:hypothetical protein